MGYPAAPTLKLYFTSIHFILQSPDTGVTAQLILERTTGRCYCTENFDPFENGASENDLYYLEVFAILGILTIDSILYIGVITDADVIGSLHGANIYEIKGIELIPFIPNSWEPETQAFEKENVSKLFTSGFYFSYFYDLTRNLQDVMAGDNVHARADSSFYWNLELSREFISQGVDSQWLIPIVQGFISISQTVYNEIPIIISLISRRSCERTGTRYNCRGVDEDGNVANYVETEQILQVHDKTFAYVQSRGSVPIYWEQTGITAQVAITKPQESSLIAFKKHLNSLLEKYSHITLINLLQENKAYEKVLTNEFEQVFQVARGDFSSKIAYQYYDFHLNCKGQRYTAINDLIKGLQDYYVYYKFYMESSLKVQAKQKGLMRTNCLDCLDRTNVLQSYISWGAISMFFQEINIEFPGQLDQSGNIPIGKCFKNMWADNGDMLSYQYTGTASTISSITRGDKQGLRALISKSIKSIGRFYHANLNDVAKQKTIEAVLRKRKDSTQITRIETEIFSRENDYTRYFEYKVKIMTWNLAGKKISLTQELENFIDGDFLVFSFQEVVKLNPNTVLRENSNVSRVNRIKIVLAEACKGKYTCMVEHSLIGILLLVYCRNEIRKSVTGIEIDYLKLGFAGKMGNKGAVVGRFAIENTTVCVIACHLASGISKNETRKSQIRDIQADVFVKDRKDRRFMQIFEHDYKFLCGDLNFRIDLNGRIVRHLVSEKAYNDLLESDQLLQAFREGLLPGYKESKISFPPTYKFDKGTDIYDTSKKQRVPAWCDRIVYNGDTEALVYNSLNIRTSDHRPVIAEFLLRCKKFDEKKKQELTDFLMQNE